VSRSSREIYWSAILAELRRSLGFAVSAFVFCFRSCTYTSAGNEVATRVGLQDRRGQPKPGRDFLNRERGWQSNHALATRRSRKERRVVLDGQVTCQHSCQRQRHVPARLKPQHASRHRGPRKVVATGAETGAGNGGATCCYPRGNGFPFLAGFLSRIDAAPYPCHDRIDRHFATGHAKLETRVQFPHPC
jgi:hypothetical protein